MKRIITFLAFITLALTTNAADSELVEGTKDSVCKLTALNTVQRIESATGYKYQVKNDDIQQSIEGSNHYFLIDVVRNLTEENFMYVVKINHRQVSQNDSKLCEIESLEKIKIMKIKQNVKLNSYPEVY